jgi:hypothetical protein
MKFWKLCPLLRSAPLGPRALPCRLAATAGSLFAGAPGLKMVPRDGRFGGGEASVGWLGFRHSASGVATRDCEGAGAECAGDAAHPVRRGVGARGACGRAGDAEGRDLSEGFALVSAVTEGDPWWAADGRGDGLSRGVLLGRNIV